MQSDFFTGWIFFLFLLPSQVFYGQSNPSIDSLVNIGKTLSQEYPDSSLVFSYDAYRQSVEADYYWGKLNASQWISEAYGMKGEIDSAYRYDNISLDLAVTAKDSAEIANNLVAIAQKQARQGNNQQSIAKYHEARIIMEARRDTYDLTDLHLRMGNSFDNLDQLDSAMINYDLARMYGLADKDTLYVGYAIQNMATMHKKMGNVEKALEVINDGIDLLIESGDKYNILSAYNNRGVIYKELQEYDKALADYAQVRAMSIEIDYPRGTMASSINGGILSNIVGDYAEAEKQLAEGADIAKSLQVKLSESDARANLAESLFQQGKYPEAERQLNLSLQLSRETGSLEKQFDGHEVGKKLYMKKGNLNKALFHAEQMRVFNDSIFQLDKAKQIDELQTKYETEKKEAEIVLLSKNAEIDATKRKALLGGLVLLAIAAMSIIYSLIQRRKRERAVLLKEKELEKEKRLRSEEQLEFKKKELTAKVLQLARKNEFLQSLETEVSQLKSSVDSTVNMSSQRLSRMIKHDTRDDEDWDQFAKEFSGIHSDYLSRLSEQYGAFNKNELRLISLMKMNLSSKDIADTLRISSDGIKKARYRLRKKMGLASEIDIQDYLLQY